MNEALYGKGQDEVYRMGIPVVFGVREEDARIVLILERREVCVDIRRQKDQKWVVRYRGEEVVCETTGEAKNVAVKMVLKYSDDAVVKGGEELAGKEWSYNSRSKIYRKKMRCGVVGEVYALRKGYVGKVKGKWMGVFFSAAKVYKEVEKRMLLVLIMDEADLKTEQESMYDRDACGGC